MSELPVTHRLSNAQAELGVSNVTGRVVHFGFAGGPNLLWESPQAPQVAGGLRGWVNWGGDKLWLWPQEDWDTWTGGTVRVPGDPASQPHQVEVAGRRLRMTSPLVPGYGVRMVREIELDAAGCGATFINRVEQVSAPSLPLAYSPWVVTQVPASGQMLARLLPDATPPGHGPFPGRGWEPQNIQIAGRIVTLTWVATPGAKQGLDADALGVVVGDALFIVRTPAASNDGGPFEPFRRAQMFRDADQSAFRPAGTPAYVEMEFTGPLKKLAVGQSSSLMIRWEVVALRKGGPSPAEVLERAGM
jgi:hypothetical protein